MCEVTPPKDGKLWLSQVIIDNVVRVLDPPLRVDVKVVCGGTLLHGEMTNFPKVNCLAVTEEELMKRIALIFVEEYKAAESTLDEIKALNNREVRRMLEQKLNPLPKATRDWYHAAGDCTCPECGHAYRLHPGDPESMFEQVMFLHVLCNGDRVKL